jgi:hypothetical protein
MKRTIITTTLLVFFVMSIFAQRPPTLTDDDVEATKTTKPNSKPTTTTNSTPAAKSKIDPTWVDLFSAEGGFSISMPATATKTEFPFGKSEADSFKAFTSTENGIVYMAGYADGYKIIGSEEKITQLILDQMVGIVAKAFKGKLINQHDISSQNLPGKEVELENEEENKLIKLRLFAGTKRVFVLLSLASKSEAQSDKIPQFLDSFKIGK